MATLDPAAAPGTDALRLSRRRLLGSAAALAAAQGGIAFARPGAGGGLWASLDLLDADGQRFRLADLEPTLRLVKLWAHWCPGCLLEMPTLLALADAVGRDLEIVLISNAEDFDNDRAAAREAGIPFRLATPASANHPDLVRAALFDRDGAYVVPRTLLFAGAETALVWEHTGSRDWSAEAARIKAQLG